jgi:2-polyprenyl-6-methoxyphenol hydroxylase-like FAD-dependent oxidoreductase
MARILTTGSTDGLGRAAALARTTVLQSRTEVGGHAVIVGASLAGLMTALALSRARIGVTLLERSGDSGRTGTALYVEPGFMQTLLGGRARIAMASGIQTWFTVHAGLRAAVDADPRIALHQHTAVQRVGQDATSAWAESAHGVFRGDIVIGADGHRSIVRASVAPDAPDARFAGYVIWLGLSQETDIAAPPAWPNGVDFLERNGDILLGYPLPGAAGATQPNGRQLGWAWYDASENALLRQKGCVQGDVVHHGLRRAQIPDEVYQKLARKAERHWPSPWRDAIRDCVHRQAVIGTPIAEYLPERLVNGRLAIVGDAAHVPTPMTGKGFAASLQDALALGEAAAGGLYGDTAMNALEHYEEMRLDSARSLVQSGQIFSRSFADRGR